MSTSRSPVTPVHVVSALSRCVAALREIGDSAASFRERNDADARARLVAAMRHGDDLVAAMPPSVLAEIEAVMRDYHALGAAHLDAAHPGPAPAAPSAW